MSDILVGIVFMLVWLLVNLIEKLDVVNFFMFYKVWLCFDIVCGMVFIMNFVFISIDCFLVVIYFFCYLIIVI